MIKVKKDLIGMVFGQLEVLNQTDDYIRPDNGKHEAMWLCKCSCENIVAVKGSHLVNGRTKSCGCLRKTAMRDTMKKYNHYSELLNDEHGNYYIGYTSNTNKEFYIDEEDYNKVKDYCWYEHTPKDRFSVLQAYNPDTRHVIKMHILLGYKNYDHKDRNELNNRKYNLRSCTSQENSFNRNKRSDNTSGYIGVTWNKDKQKWIAQIQYKKKMYNLGGYNNIEDALISRLKAELKYFGDFAPQKDLFKKYNITNESEIKNNGTD